MAAFPLLAAFHMPPARVPSTTTLQILFTPVSGQPLKRSVSVPGRLSGLAEAQRDNSLVGESSLLGERAGVAGR